MADAPGPGRVLRLERRLAAPPEAVFAAWTDPGMLGQWMSPFGHADVSIDLRVGGRLRVAMIDGQARIDHTGEFLEVDPPRRLRFTWVSPYTGPQGSEVTVTFEPEAAGTRLLLVHLGLPAGVVDPHREGWAAILGRLSVVVSSVGSEANPA